jgi:hypothetical protein
VDRCRALREKYLTLQRMRLAHAQSGAVAPREELRALARRFPGALRELDRLPFDRIEARLAELDAALGGAGPLPDWVPVQLAFHGWLRLALLARAGAPDETFEQAQLRLRAGFAPGPGEPDPGQLRAGDLAAIRRPPNGRLTGWVYARISTDLGHGRQVVEAALFSDPGCRSE